MDFRRSAQLDDRRRRVLMEEVASEPEADAGAAPPEPSGKRAAARAYSEAVLRERQPRISDLIPVRPFAMTMLVLLLLTGIAAIETLYICWETRPLPARAAGEAIRPLSARAIDLAARGNLASWYSTLLLAGGAGLCVAIFLIRCHREDDYRGSYRVWLWTVAALLWGSLDAATGVHETLGGLIAIFARSPQLADLGWLALYLLVFGALGIRLGIETWHAVGAFSTLALGALLYLLAGMTTVGWLPLPGMLLATVLSTTLVMLAHVTLVFGLAVYARHVHLDAQGKLPLRLKSQSGRPKKKSRAKLSVVGSDEKKSSAAAQPAAKITAATATEPGGSKPPSGAKPGPLASRVAAATADDDDEEDADDDSDNYQHLSKSERRRLKKLMRQQRRAA